MRRGLWASGFLLLGVASAQAQAPTPQFDANCRPIPLPGYMMAPQPPNQDCLDYRARIAREQEQQRRQAQQRAAAAEKARQERLAALKAECEQTPAADIRAAFDQDTTLTSRYGTVLDLTDPRFAGEVCRNEIMTSRGELGATISFKVFNNKRYVQLSVRPR